MDETWLEQRRASLDALSSLESERAAFFVREQRALVAAYELLDRQPDGNTSRDPAQFVALDIAMACGVSQITASTRLTQALHLVRNLPRSLALVESGELTLSQVLVLREETATLPVEVCAELESDVLPTVLGMTSAETRRAVRKALARLDAKNADERREARRKERRAFVTPKPDGQALLGVLGDAEQTSRFYDELSLLAKLTFGTDDPRTLDQQRSDLALTLAGFGLASRHGHGPSLRHHLGLATEDEQTCDKAVLNRLTPAQQSRVQAVVLVPVETALGLSDNPAELVGYGPITGEHARELLVSAELRHATVDERTGRLVGLATQTIRLPRGLATWPTRHFSDNVYELDTRHHDPGAPPRRHTRPYGPRPPAPRPARSLTLQDALLGLLAGPQPVQTTVEDQHDPSAQLARFLRLRDQRCHGPGCSQPAHRCDLEHWQAHPDGPTSASNVAPVSRRCHNAKTYGGWTFTPHPDGTTTWTSPLGQTWVRQSRTEPVNLARLRSIAGVVPPTQKRRVA